MSKIESFAQFSDGTPVPFDGKFHVDPLDPSKSVRCLELRMPPDVSEIISGGNTAYLGLLSNGSVLKFLVDRDDPFPRKALDIEDSILSALGDHKRITKYLGKGEHGLRFERAVEAAEALAFVHARKVIHCDIHPNNFLLDGALDIQLCDFSGSLFGDLDGFGMESTRFYLPRDPQATSNVRSDLFALGSTIYYIMSGREPYASLPDDEVTARYSRGIFPELDLIPCADTILACWKGEYNNADQVFLALLEKSKTPNPRQLGQRATELPYLT
ncbi:hypothetical protein IQ07DRAFT_620832 [Pyrenochaeta sp. DS3sAY3a]|nr:hypothetical protein IQ07DRAFT_620832 [Pyrenochaeta sp. DS3sAY3a]